MDSKLAIQITKGLVNTPVWDDFDETIQLAILKTIQLASAKIRQDEQIINVDHQAIQDYIKREYGR